MKKLIAINGSPRKNANTAILMGKALDGAQSAGAQTELINLYSLNYKGCISCFNCKLKNGKNYGKCSVRDDLLPVFDKIENSDALLLGSPIYFSSVSGEMRSFLERFLFQYTAYTKQPVKLFGKELKTGFIYTMNIDDNLMKEIGMDKHLGVIEKTISKRIGPIELLHSYDTYQFDDYSKYVSDRFDEKKKAEVRKNNFPEDCSSAFEMGKRLVIS